jgi:NADH-quinone oxidoreductase subunit H
MMSTFALLAPPNFLNDLLLKLCDEQETLNYVVWPFIQIGAVITLVAVWALYASYLERKISAFMQARLGPMRVGKWGLLQPIADAVKLLTKEDLVPEKADPYIFRYAPYISVAATFITFSVVPFAPDWGVITDVNIGLLLILSISSVGVLALILAGWSSNSKYALLGGLRSSAQMVSYEVSMGLSLVGALMFARTLSMSGITQAQAADGPLPYLVYQPLAFVVFLVSGIAENNRAPFDLPEAESELVAGFHTEYSGMRWSLFFMAEYAAMVVVAAVATTLFLGGWYFPGVLRLAGGYNNLYVILSLVVFIVKMALLLYLYFWLRWTFPRYRYDQLMDLGWKWMIPASLLNIVWTALTIFALQALDGWRGLDTLEPPRAGAALHAAAGLNLTPAGKGVAIAFGLAGLFIAALFLAYLNRHSRDFNLKRQRREIRLVDVPKGAPAVATAAADNA